MKRIKKLVLAAVVLVVLVVVVAVLWVDRLARLGVEKGGTFAFGVPTQLDAASIGLVSGRSTLAGLDIANPQGFETPHLLKLNDAALAVSLGSLTGDTVEIPEFSLSGIDVNLERKAGKANFKVILDNLGRFESSRKEPQDEKPAGEGKKFIIREIIIKDVKVNLALLPIGGDATRLTVPIEELRLRDVGSDSSGGVVLGQVAGTVLKAIILAAMEKGGGTIPGEMLNDLNSAMASLAPLKDIGASLAVGLDGTVKDISTHVEGMGTQLRQAQDSVQQVGDSVKDAQQNLTEGLGGLLKKKEDTPE